MIEPDLAFKLTLVAKGPNIVVAELVPAKAYYRYKKKIRFSATDGSGVTISAVTLPGGRNEDRPDFWQDESLQEGRPGRHCIEPCANEKTVSVALQ